ncbi:MAG: HD domain-containing protein, partial [Candidatus Sericytochromatia bacterium]|nr:HD domain-containing protein [Candidatus Sericytochromatia bacterium]
MTSTPELSPWPTARLNRLQASVTGRCTAQDPAHDWQHVLRVAMTTRQLAEAEGGDIETVVAAALCHELFNYPKNHPESHRSGEVCAAHATDLLTELDWPSERILAVSACIRVHGFSAGLTAETLEARILQDADRLDAIGAIGIARCFATCSAMGRPFYDPADPFCQERQPDDQAWGVDHFYRKLLHIPERLHTASARAMATERIRFVHAFL